MSNFITSIGLIFLTFGCMVRSQVKKMKANNKIYADETIVQQLVAQIPYFLLLKNPTTCWIIVT
ncbi:hypothetical protein A2526_06225 [candidate division WOR-1 bacterium RIFOXYD2_FULL_36_8]|uniref:Uncharacterized protein n=1 Tax=candidate division WOR-1 bacterium RIFOXYB2_FULL_36_35 TaxID=1802578 RepID=A0A1F4RZ83_UNCSA|nr:MAG: hypothetical protein A2230_01940 [candidate division WOR-1 bacterium RIFOXYA2_FULL_36_21]OGC13471.1 MAG: hypothetical protein A2290_07260 [candidate division WOR-1 bacterium RIFOXYB2_FULL_36_35]OGC38473.1 MAG: hypothetical protein A2526_06225 [candidate division WOR-1 bacterium RIFOXYD2_FULL_36_8]